MRATLRGALLATTVLVVCLTAAPAMAAKDLQVSTATCTGVTVVGEGLPASTQVFLLVRNLASGATVGGKPTPVTTEADGTVQASVRLDLNGVRTVDVSIWTKSGETLQMAARDVASTNCGKLPMTGASAHGGMALLAGVLLTMGAAALWGARRFRSAPTGGR
jgi:LPXTG-motif cell wall-anchored protein